jgi:hypothetical protein
MIDELDMAEVEYISMTEECFVTVHVSKNLVKTLVKPLLSTFLIE